MHSNQPFGPGLGRQPAHVNGPGLAQPMQLGLIRPIFLFLFYFLKKYYCFKKYLWCSHFLFMFFLLISGSIFMSKKYKSGIKIPGFFCHKLLKIQKKIKKKTFLCIRPSVSNLKYHIVFFMSKNNILACILALITSLLKSREYWPK